jgi:hypothetical protein
MEVDDLIRQEAAGLFRRGRGKNIVASRPQKPHDNRLHVGVVFYHQDARHGDIRNE